METREQLSQEIYQQAVKFAQHFTNGNRSEFEFEAKQRYEFEKAQLKPQLQHSAKNQPLAKKGILSLCVIFLLGVTYYWQSGRYPLVKEGLQLHRQFQQESRLHQGSSKNERYILSLQNQLRENPNLGELWYELGQVYALSNDFDSALVCYTNAEKLLGKRPSILSAMATAHYYDNKQRITPTVRELIEQALALDKNESASLLLLASDSFLNNDYQQALDYWRRVLDGQNESIDRRAIIQSMATARQMLENYQSKLSPTQ